MLDCTVAYGLSFLFPFADTAVGASLRDHGEFARTELDFLVDMAGDKGTFIDVGANIGAIALPFASRRPNWKVIAVEANRPIAGILSANALANRLYNVEVFHAAIGAEARLVPFPALSLASAGNFGALGFNADTGATETVRMATLDEMAPADTRLIKIDVEGYEPEVLKGAAELLKRRDVIWLAEATIQNPAASAEIISIFQAAGYTVHWFYAPFATPASEKRAPEKPGKGDANVVALPPGVANSWNLPPVAGPGDTRPVGAAPYPYLARYGYV